MHILVQTSWCLEDWKKKEDPFCLNPFLKKILNNCLITFIKYAKDKKQILLDYLNISNLTYFRCRNLNIMNCSSTFISAFQTKHNPKSSIKFLQLLKSKPFTFSFPTPNKIPNLSKYIDRKEQICWEIDYTVNQIGN